ncbi:MAG: LamG domain-containing protein [Balneolaceae bacterium]|nr:MAG: LamG domain-containing protein [Balneolaceae bacterium]
MIHLKRFTITLLVFLFMGCSQFQSSNTDSVGSINFTSSLPMQYEFADQPALPERFGAGEFTMELWIKPDHTAPIGETWRGSYDQISNWSESDRRAYSSHGWWYEGNWLLDGEWHHIACVRRWAEDGGAILELWVDGQLIAETSIAKRVDMTAFWHNLPHPDNPAELGGWAWGAEVMTAWKTVFTQYEDYKGLMDELRFWNRALTHQELENDWQRAVKGEEPGLAGWYDFSEVKDNAFYDRLNPDQRIELHHFGKENFSSERAPLRELE